MSITVARFDAADYLTDEETVAAYLTAAMEDPDPAVLLAARKDVARARKASLDLTPAPGSSVCRRRGR